MTQDLSTIPQLLMESKGRADKLRAQLDEETNLQRKLLGELQELQDRLRADLGIDDTLPTPTPTRKAVVKRGRWERTTEANLLVSCTKAITKSRKAGLEGIAARRAVRDHVQGVATRKYQLNELPKVITDKIDTTFPV